MHNGLGEAVRRLSQLSVGSAPVFLRKEPHSFGEDPRSGRFSKSECPVNDPEVMASSPPLLATYGTLMRAFGGPGQLGGTSAAVEASFVAPCRIPGILYDLGRFPGAVPGDGVIEGELFRLRGPEVWAALDQYEGYDPDREENSLFVRRRVSLDDPANRTAWVYWYNGDPTDHPRVPSGDWAAYVGERSSS